MTFVEWVNQTHKELPSNVPNAMVKEVMVYAIRVAVEEMMANRAEADLDIGGIGRFYLNHRVVHNPLSYVRKGETEPEKAIEYSKCWTIQFKPSLPLKQVINDKRDIHDLLIGGNIAVYPEYIYSEDGMKTRRGRFRPHKRPKITKNYNIQFSKQYKQQLEKLEKEMTRKNLPDKE